MRETLVVLIVGQVSDRIKPKVVRRIPVVNAERIMEISRITLCVVLIKKISVVVGRRRDELSES